ncbi:MAG: hypothetical protein ICV70_02200 [Jiangellaceae bacterium]|nr:hypothetical protein [Jiangellaceae bacterium]
MRPSARRPPAAIRFAAAALAVLAACIGCASTPDTAGVPANLTAQLRQSRLDQSTGNIRIQLTNEGTARVHVRDLVLHVDPFPNTRSENDAALRPHQLVDFRLPTVEPTCAAGTPTPGRATAELTVDGRPVEVDVIDDQNVLGRMLTGTCLREQLAEVVTVGLGPEWVLDSTGTAMRGTIDLTRVGDGPAVTLRQVNGSATVGFQPIRRVPPLATLDPGQSAVSVPVQAAPTRCEPHARSEDKKRFVFPAWLRMQGVKSDVYVELKADLALQARLDQLCDARSG